MAGKTVPEVNAASEDATGVNTTTRRSADRSVRDGSRTATSAHRRAGLAAGILLAAFAVVSPVVSPIAAQSSGDGFLFQEPRGSFAIRGGISHANAGGDLFDDATKRLTLDRGDFSGFTAGADLAIRVAPRFDVVLGAAYAGTSTTSEYRDLVDQDNLPIEQTTSLRRAPVTASVRAYLTPRGRTVGSFAWVPARFAPYVGVGGGAMWYRFRQEGDFVDFETNKVVNATVESSQWTPAAQTMAGLDYSLTPRIALTGEGKYTWAKANLNDSFTGFDKIDLSGVSATVGLYVRF